MANSIKTTEGIVSETDILEFYWCSRTKPTQYTTCIHTHSIKHVYPRMYVYML